MASKDGTWRDFTLSTAPANLVEQTMIKDL